MCLAQGHTPHVVLERYHDVCISRSVVSSDLVGRTWNLSLGVGSRKSLSSVSNTRLVLCLRWLRAIFIFELTYVVFHMLAGLFMCMSIFVNSSLHHICVFEHKSVLPEVVNCPNPNDWVFDVTLCLLKDWGRGW